MGKCKTINYLVELSCLPKWVERLELVDCNYTPLVKFWFLVWFRKLIMFLCVGLQSSGWLPWITVVTSLQFTFQNYCSMCLLRFAESSLGLSKNVHFQMTILTKFIRKTSLQISCYMYKFFVSLIVKFHSRHGLV